MWLHKLWRTIAGNATNFLKKSFISLVFMVSKSLGFNALLHRGHVSDTLHHLAMHSACRVCEQRRWTASFLDKLSQQTQHSSSSS
jgi:hypothetical protein